MSLRAILTSGDGPAARAMLLRPSSRVPRVDRGVYALLDDLRETMAAVSPPGALGLAAVQVGVPLRVCVVRCDGDVLELCNPAVVRSSEEQLVQHGTEGCLSLPGLLGVVIRAERITVRYLDRRGREVREQADGLLARVLAHEIDHCEGRLFPARMRPEDVRRMEAAEDTPA